MGIFYEAHDNATQRKVAVKLPLGKFVDDEDAKKRFAHEAEAWTDLIHPNIVHAFDVRDEQSTDDCPAIFMDYCDGGSLADRIKNGFRLSMTEALDTKKCSCDSEVLYAEMGYQFFDALDKGWEKHHWQCKSRNEQETLGITLHYGSYGLF